MSRYRLVITGVVAVVALAGASVALDPSASGSSPTAAVPLATTGGSAASAPVVGTVSVGTGRDQRMQGFGASGAWVGDDLIHFPKAVRDRLGAMLFGRRGIALSGYRYNVGGGGVGVTNPVRAPESFLTSKGTYDWSADPGGRALLVLAKRYHVPELTAFVNSAPARWTTNGKNCGGSLSPEPASMLAFGHYLATVVRHFRQTEGITFSWVSPMNEPDDSFSGCNQEGMAVPAGQRVPLVRDVGHALASEAPWSHVIADESATATIQLGGEAPAWLLTQGTSKWLAAVATHGYDFPSAQALGSVRSLASRVHKPVWTTEVCCYNGRPGLLGFGTQYDPTMSSGIWLADTIWQDLAVADESAFYWWSAASPSMGCDPKIERSCATSVNAEGWNDGLVYYDPHYATDKNFQLYTTKRFYVMGNFSRYIPPGAVRQSTNGSPAGVHTLAFSHGHDWTVVLIDDHDPTSSPTSLRVVLPNRVTATGGAVTSATQDLAPVRARRVGTHFSVTVSPQSVTTLTFRAGMPVKP